MNFVTTYRTRRAARWAFDSLFVCLLVVTFAALHMAPSLGLLTDDVLGML